MSRIIKIGVIALGFVLIGLLQPLMAVDVVASLGTLDGNVKVLRDARKIAAKEGLILYDQDVVETSKRARATIIFRDGSEIRLFQSTRFVIEKSEESAEGSRKFFNSFKLKLGSFWGRFTKGRQNTKISTPTATIGIKGTNLSVSQVNGTMDLSLSNGEISVANYDETIELSGGYKLTGVKEDGKLSDKISKLTYQVSLTPDQRKIMIPEKGEVSEVYFSLQLINSTTKANFNKTGKVYLSSDVDKVVFPRDVTLNSRGYARIKAQIKPFQKNDYRDGKLNVFAVMDGEEFMDVGAGKTMLTYEIPDDVTRTIQIHMETGEVVK